MWEYVMVWLWVCVCGVGGRKRRGGREREKEREREGDWEKVCHTNIDHKKTEAARLFIEVNIRVIDYPKDRHYIMMENALLQVGILLLNT